MRKTLVVIILTFLSVSIYSDNLTRSVHQILPTGDRVNIEKYNNNFNTVISELIINQYNEGTEIWHYCIPSGETGKTTAIGYSAGYVFAGTWYGGNKMFVGISGAGTPDWETPDPEVGANQYWTYYGSSSAASDTTDIFYGAFAWKVYDNMGTPSVYTDDTLISYNTKIRKYNSSSSTPVWEYESINSFILPTSDDPGNFTCSKNGEAVTVAGKIDGHLAIAVFHDTSNIPVLIYEDTSITSVARYLEITDDGSKIIFRKSAILYRVDVATGVLEATYNLGASTDCFAISGDGSTVAYGFTSMGIAKWNGSSYSQTFSMPASGYYCGTAAISSDNSTAYIGLYRNDYRTNKIFCIDINSNNPLWVYDYPVGSGSNQDFMETMDCSSDGRWLVAGSWGCATGGGPEIEVFDRENPTSPTFTIDTPGSVFDVDITPDGCYISATGKHVHANIMGSGNDTYFAYIDEASSVEEENKQLFNINQAFYNHENSTATFFFSMLNSSFVKLVLYDISGKKVESLINNQMTSGDHNVVFNLNLVNGIYFYRLTIGNNTISNKLFITN